MYYNPFKRAVIKVGSNVLTNENGLNIKAIRSTMIQKRLGHKPFDEVIHRDNLAITAEYDT